MGALERGVQPFVLSAEIFPRFVFTSCVSILIMAREEALERGVQASALSAE